jgi:alanine dehydrogenase
VPLLLTNDDVTAVLSMADCLDPMEQAFAELGKGLAVSRSRSDMVVLQPDPGRHYILKTCDAALPSVGLSAVRVTSNMMQEVRAEGARRLDPLPLANGGGYVGLVFLFDMQRLNLVAIIHDARIQVMRAGAAYGVAAKYLARADAAVVGVLGSGQQAREQLTALALVRPIRRANVFSPTKANRERFAGEMSARLGFEVVASGDMEAVVTGADIVALTTSSSQPVFPGEWLRPGQHVSTVRVNEVDDVARNRASVIVLQSTESSSLLMPAAQTEPDWFQGLKREPDPRCLAFLGDVVVGRHVGRTNDEQITLFGGYASFGPATGYSALGAIALERARALRIGRELPDEWFVQQESS